MAFTPFTKEDQPTMANFNEKFLSAILEGKTQALDEGVKIATGSYTGTGTYGASNKNSLTFDFDPKLVYIYKTTGNYTYQMFCGVGAARTFTAFAGDSSSGTATLSRYSSVMNLNGNQLTWYYYEGAGSQLNEAGGTYNYIAIG